jgi:hypothetical protein
MCHNKISSLLGLWRTTRSRRALRCPTLKWPYPGEKDVFRLDIAVGDAVLVEEVHGIHHLFHYLCHPLFRKSGYRFVQVVEQGAVGSVLQDQVDVQLVVEESV